MKKFLKKVKKGVDNIHDVMYNKIIKGTHHTPHNESEDLKMATIKNINEVMKELAQYTDMMDELKVQIESLQDEVKAYMTEQGVDEVIGENGEKATWRGVISNRFDSTAFKKDFLDIYKEYTKKTEYKRFTFAR